MARTSRRPPSRRALRPFRMPPAPAPFRPGSRARVLEHPTARLARRRALPGLVLERVLESLAPQDGFSLGLAGTWPQPERELALRRLLLDEWGAEVGRADVGPLGTGPLVEALRARAAGLRRGSAAYSLGSARLASVLERTADALAGAAR